MERLNQELILKLREGKIAVSNNGTKDQLIEVVKAACPNDIDCKAAGNKFYSVEDGLWGGYSQTDLPILSIHDFYTTPSYDELLRQNREMREALIKINQKANNSDYEYSERIFDINGYVIDSLSFAILQNLSFRCLSYFHFGK